jgi:hypothetical protein
VGDGSPIPVVTEMPATRQNQGFMHTVTTISRGGEIVHEINVAFFEIHPEPFQVRLEFSASPGISNRPALMEGYESLMPERESEGGGPGFRGAVHVLHICQVVPGERPNCQ